MNTKIVATLWVAGLLIGVSGAVRANDADVKKTLEVQYAKEIAASKAKDVNALMALSTPDFKVKMNGGKILTYAEVKQDFKEQFAHTQSIKELSVKITALKVTGDKAVATVQQKAVIVATVQGKVMTLSSEQTSNDTWVKTSAGWKLSYEELSKVHNVASDKR